MRRISTFFYGIGQGIRNIFRNRVFSLASIGTMAACIFLFGIFYVVLSNFKFMVKEAETSVGITVFFDDGITEEEIGELQKKIAVRAEVHDITYTSAQEAWEEYKSTRLSQELAESFGEDNPLENSASFTIRLSDVSMQDSLIRYVSGLEGIRKINDTGGMAERLSGLNKIITVGSTVIIIILLMVSGFLISITVSTGVSVRRQEISIMKLIGATDYFIRIPYVVEGVIIGLIGSAIPLLLVKALYVRVTAAMADSFSSIFNTVSFLDVDSVMRTLVPVSLLIGMGIGFIGSRATLKRQLKKIEVN